jgi:hypothetical protein
VIWTRHREPPDATPMIREWFAEHDFDEIGFDTEDGYSYGVGAHRLAGPALAFQPDLRLFDFVGNGQEAHT